MDDADLFLNLGELRIFIEPNAVTVKKTREIRTAMTAVKAKHSSYTKVPRKPKETSEQWTERYLEYIGQINVRKEKETEAAYLERVLSPTSLEDDLVYTFDVLKALATCFVQGEKVNDQSFECAVLEDVNNFIVRILKKCKYPTTEFELNR